MTLHSLVYGNTTTTYWWYYAVPNERRGKLHLLKVPALFIDERLLVPPSSLAHEESRNNWLRWRRSHRVIVPNSIDEPQGDTWCHTPQVARGGWQIASDQIWAERGVCVPCLHFRNANRHLVGYQPTNEASTQNLAVGRYYLYNEIEPTRWLKRVREEYYDEHD